MSNLPTESEIYGKSKNDNDGIVLNIYNKPAQNNEESNENSEINQTEANLKLEDNYYNNLDNNPMALQNNKFTIYDNTRENPSPYPLSENRGIQYPAPPVQNQRNYYNSVNPNFVNDGKDKSIKFGNDNINRNLNSNQELNKNQLIGIKHEHIYKIEKEKKYKIMTPGNVCIFLILTFLCFPLGIIFCVYISKKKSLYKVRERNRI